MRSIHGLRWWIVALICAGTIINYLSRNALGVLAPRLKTEMGISTAQYSYIVGAFQLGYTIMQPVCGMIVDRIGLRAGFALFATLWSIAGCLHGLVTGWVSLAGARALMGLTEAAAIPSGMKAVAEWFPNKEKSIAVGFFNVGTSLGALLAPPLVGFLTLAYGWRTAFVATGAIGFVWAAIWFACYRSPRTSAWLSPDERSKILSGQPSPESAPKLPLRRLFRVRRFWAIAVPRFFAEPAWQTFSFWIPLYLATERHMDLAQIAVYAWLPFLAADLGGIFGGYFSPFLMKYLRVPLIWSRVCGVVLGAVLMIGPACIGLVEFPVHGDRAVQRRRVRASDDFGARQYAQRRHLRYPGRRNSQRLRRHGRLDRWARLLAAGRRLGGHDRIRPSVRTARGFRHRWGGRPDLAAPR